MAGDKAAFKATDQRAVQEDLSGSHNANSGVLRPKQPTAQPAEVSAGTDARVGTKGCSVGA